MKTYAYQLSSEDQKRLFFHSWYHDPRQKFTRILAFPLCLAIGVLAIVYQVGLVYVAAGTGLIAVGLYYLALPFYTFGRSKKEGLSATLTVTQSELRYEDGQNRTVVPRQAIERLSLKSDYLLLGVKAERRVAYVTFYIKGIAEREEFIEKLRALAGIR
jgi:hypothetical protein